MLGSAFGIAMTIILVIYAGYYGFNIIKDLFFDKSKEVVAEVTVEEKEVDIGDELNDFTKYDANEDEKLAKARKEAEEAARKREEEGEVVVGEPLPDGQRPTDDTSEGDDNDFREDESQDGGTGGEEENGEASEETDDDANDSQSADEPHQNTDKDTDEQQDDAAFAEVETQFKEMDGEPTMSGGIEADSFEKMDDAAFKKVDYYFHQIAA